MTEGVDLTGTVALITGASRGLGRALARALARHGAKVAMCARSHEALREARAAVEAVGGEAVARPADVADPDAVARLVQEVERRWGPVTVLVNNASLLGERVPLRAYPLPVWRDVMEVNLTGALVVTQAVLPGMRATGTGSIINVTSGVGNVPRADWGAYAVSKWALEAFTYNLALEERDAGIRVNAVDPGRMRTRMRRAAYPEEDPASLPTPDDVVDVFLWLASDDSRTVTGQRFRAQEWARR